MKISCRRTLNVDGWKKLLAREKNKLKIMSTLTCDNIRNQLTALHECFEQANILRDKDPSMAWEHLTKAELVVDQTLKTLN